MVTRWGDPRVGVNPIFGDPAADDKGVDVCAGDSGTTMPNDCAILASFFGVKGLWGGLYRRLSSSP